MLNSYHPRLRCTTDTRLSQFLAPTEMVFGFSAAMMNAYVNGALVGCKDTCIGDDNIGFLGVMTVLTGAQPPFS